jgi:hypothetical protein
MALYILDDETGEAIQVVDVDEWAHWRGGVSERDLTLARTDIVEVRVQGQKVVVDVDALKSPYHNGIVLDTVITKLVPNCTNEYRHPWQTGVVGEDPEYWTTTTTQKQALQSHRSAVNFCIKKNGGKVLS